MKNLKFISLLSWLPFIMQAQVQITVSAQKAEVPKLCMVTVDEAGKRNEIIWDNKLYPDAKTFLIYRVTLRGEDSLIGRVEANEPSIFIDSDGEDGSGNPESSSQKYKFSYLDQKQTESERSMEYETIHVTSNGKGVFSWNAYNEKVLGKRALIKYTLSRISPAGVVTKIDSTDTNLLIDPEFKKYAGNNYKWFVVFEGVGCDFEYPPGQNARRNGTKSNNSNE